MAHDFPKIGRKVMILNARQIFIKEDATSALRSSIILLAMEDVTEMMDVAEMLARHTTDFEKTMAERTGKLEDHISELQHQINGLKFKTKVRT